MDALKKYPLAFAGILIIGFVIGYAVNLYLGGSFAGGNPLPGTEAREERENGSQSAPESGDSNSRTGAMTVSGDGSVSAADQAAGRAVLVEEATLPATGWVVVHELKGGELGNALGAARRDAGAHDKVIVDLLRATEPSVSYAVVLYVDDGNRAFDLHGDSLVEKEGSVIMDQFTATTPVGPSGN